MTETLHPEAPSAPPPPDARRLVRDPDEKVVAGVCAAFGRYTDTDPVLWRVTIGVLTLFGGAGIALYLLGWLLVPRTGEPQSTVERLLRRPDVSVGGVVVVVLGAVLLLGLLDDGPGVGALVVVGGIAYLVSRERREKGPLPPVEPVPYGPPPATYGSAPWPTPVPGPPRERSPLTGITLSAAALLAGLLLALGIAGVDGITVPRVLAAVLLVVGAGLLVGTVYGRGRWLIPVGLVLALALGGSVAAQAAGLQDGVGERSWDAVDGGDYELGAGEAFLDLRSLRGVAGADVQARVGLGHLVLLVPEDLTVRVTSQARAGAVTLVELDGTRTSRDLEEGDRVRSDDVVGTGDVTADVDLEVGLGEIEVRRVRG